MTPWGRAMLGAACGAVATLALHPVSRPYLLGAIVHFPASRCIAAAGLDQPLPSPNTREAAAQWLQVGAVKLGRGFHLSVGEIRTLLAIDDAAARAYGENAFWYQMKAVYLSSIKRDQEARLAWLKASYCNSWDDYQSDRLREARARLAMRIGWDQAWTYGFVFFQRSDAAAAQIQRYAQRLVRETSLEKNGDLLLRYATIRNGSLLREGSRSIKVGTHGWQMVELATYPPYLSGIRSPKRIWIAETTLTAKLRQQGLVEESKKARDAFGNNEGWLFLTGAAPPDSQSPAQGGAGLWRTVTEDQSPEDNLRVLCLASVGLACLPGLMAVGAILCAISLIAGSLLQTKFESMRFFPTWIVTLAALAAGGSVFWATRLWPAAVCVGLTVEFLAVGPGTPRTRKSDDLGPLYGFVLFCLWMISLGAFGLYLVATSVAANTVGPYLGPSGEYFSNSTMFLAVTSIVLSLICLVTPLWAIVRRFGTPDLLALSLRRFGTIGAIGCLAGCVIGGPLSVFGDKIVSNELSQIVANEPVYYLYVAK